MLRTEATRYRYSHMPHTSVGSREIRHGHTDTRTLEPQSTFCCTICAQRSDQKTTYTTAAYGIDGAQHKLAQIEFMHGRERARTRACSVPQSQKHKHRWPGLSDAGERARARGIDEVRRRAALARCCPACLCEWHRVSSIVSHQHTRLFVVRVGCPGVAGGGFGVAGCALNKAARRVGKCCVCIACICAFVLCCCAADDSPVSNDDGRFGCVLACMADWARIYHCPVLVRVRGQGERLGWTLKMMAPHMRSAHFEETRYAKCCACGFDSMGGNKTTAYTCRTCSRAPIVTLN